MEKFQTIKDIIFLPKKYYNGNSSPYAILKASGYFEWHDKINENDIFEVLTQHLECINQWLCFSADKRCCGWYFTEEKGKNIVGNYSSQGGYEQVIEFLDKIEACAAFIKREIEEIRDTEKEQERPQ
ncbi:MAG: hypothetical protein FWE67_15325 [Planctomycetaceae bacterium]|nr:hypothetical protein [Planctomycetaceae bacterium]